MADKPVTLKRYNNNNNIFDTIYPKTTIPQVTNLSTSLANIITDISGKVDKAGTQTITGAKTFTATTTFNDGIIIPLSNSVIDLGKKTNWFWTRFSGENWTFNNTYTGGGWARNLMEMKDAEGNAYFRIGAQGSGQSFTQMYIGPAYDNYWLSLNNTSALFKTKPQYASNPTDNNDLTRKLYVDSKLDNKVDKEESQTIKGTTTLEYPSAFVSGVQQDVLIAKVPTSATKSGAISIVKEGPNSGIGLKFEQEAGITRLMFRGSSTPGAMVWAQPEVNSRLYLDVDSIDFRGSGFLLGSNDFSPKTNNTKTIGTSGMRFNAMYATTFYENGSTLASKYAALSHTHSYDSLTSKPTNIIRQSSWNSSTKELVIEVI